MAPLRDGSCTIPYFCGKSGLETVQIIYSQLLFQAKAPDFLVLYDSVIIPDSIMSAQKYRITMDMLRMAKRVCLQGCSADTAYAETLTNHATFLSLNRD